MTLPINRSLRRGVILGLACLVMLAGACGSDDAGAPAASGPLTVEQALEVDDGERHDVDGFVVARGGVVRLCSALAESDPPQCGGASLTVIGGATADLDALFGSDLKTKQTTSWTDVFVVLDGVIADGELRLDG